MNRNLPKERSKRLDIFPVHCRKTDERTHRTDLQVCFICPQSPDMVGTCLGRLAHAKLHINVAA